MSVFYSKCCGTVPLHRVIFGSCLSTSFAKVKEARRPALGCDCFKCKKNLTGTDTPALHQALNSKVLEKHHGIELNSDRWRHLYTSVSTKALRRVVYLSFLITVVQNSAWSCCLSFVKLTLLMENTHLHLGKWQRCQISTVSSCQAPLYSKLKYDSPINTSLSWSFSPMALFQTSFEVCLPLADFGVCLCVYEERRYCQHSLIILFSLTLQATKFRQTPGSRHL